jgi:glucose/arabinose dehydrogenase
MYFIPHSVRAAATVSGAGTVVPIMRRICPRHAFAPRLTTSLTLLLAVLLGTIASGTATAATSTTTSPTTTVTVSPPALRLTRLTDLPSTTAMAAQPGNRTLYVTQQDGVVRGIRNGQLLAQPVVDLTPQVSQDGGERGLLGIAFSPDGKLLYVDYTDTAGNTRVDELSMQGAVADPGSRRTVLEVDQPQPNHNGGQLAFGPDGDLYIALGDGGAAGDSGPGHAAGGNGQSLATLLGKILRIDPTPSAGAPYTVPPDNPFVGRTGARPEIWAYGLRNPWRFSFDRANGDLWIGDVGQDAWEESDHAVATNGRDAGRGDNFGWNRLEGTHAYQGRAPANAVPPVYEVSHDTGACAIIGGFVYRGTKIAGLPGAYLFSDNCDSTIRLLVPGANGNVTMRPSGASSQEVSAFGQSNGGELFALSLNDGVFRVDTA